MQLMEEVLNAIGRGSVSLENQLMLLEDYKRLSEGKQMQNTELCKLCASPLEYSDGFLVCNKCGLENDICIRNTEENLEPEDIKTRLWARNKYNYVSYGGNILDALVGNLTPVNKPKFRSLLQEKDVPRLLAIIKWKLYKMKIPVREVSPEKLVDVLKELQFGYFYKYVMYLCERINPAFSAPEITPLKKERVLNIFKRFSAEWIKHRDEICQRVGLKRKSLPHVKTILKGILRREGLHYAAECLPSMRSIKRQEKIEMLINETWRYIY